MVAHPKKATQPILSRQNLLILAPAFYQSRILHSAAAVTGAAA
jgi:hypothetical protein